jgi:hypothetical protein
MIRIKHNDLTHWFLRDQSTLPASYVKSCQEFFKELGNEQQATGAKLQATSCKQVTSKPDCDIIKTERK